MSDSTEALDGLSYRDVQAKLKELGQPAKGTDKVLRERLALALQGVEEAQKEEAALGEEETGGQAEGEKSPRSPKKTVGRSRAGQGKASAKKATAKFVVTTEVEDGEDEGSRAQKLQSAVKAALPDAKTKVRRFSSTTDVTGAETPIQKVRRVASDSASKLQQSVRSSAQKLQRVAGDLQQEMGRRKLGWVWPLLAALLVGGLLLGGYSVWRDSQAWKRSISQQMDGLQRQASTLNDNIYRGYSYTHDRVADGALYVWDTGNYYAGDALQQARPYLQYLSTKKIRAMLPTTACCSRLNTTVLEGLTPSTGPWQGLGSSLKDAWAGLKDDPHKGTGVLLAGSSQATLHKATATIRAAVPPDCKHCFLHLKGEQLAVPSPRAVGELQKLLAGHLEGCPYAVVVIEGVDAVHSSNLGPLHNVLSEQGSVTNNGKSIPGHKALYIGTIVAPADILQVTDEKVFTSAVKRFLVSQLNLTPINNPSVAEAFRRRWDLVAPLK